MFPCEEFKIVSVCPYPKKINHSNFVNISPTLVIDTSMERSSRVLHHGNQKIDFFFQKMFNLVFMLMCFLNNFQLIETVGATSGMHRRPFEGRHLVSIIFHSLFVYYKCISLRDDKCVTIIVFKYYSFLNCLAAIGGPINSKKKIIIFLTSDSQNFDLAQQSRK